MSPASPSAPQQLFPALRLYPLNNSFATKRIPLIGGQRVKIGRPETNTKSTPSEENGIFDSKVLSRHHAEIWEEEGKIYIKDLKSSNGTFVNGERLSPEGTLSDPYELRSDDIVIFGIDIVAGDKKTIIYHKVAARAVCIFSEPGVQAAAQPEQYRQRQRKQQIDSTPRPYVDLIQSDPVRSGLVGEFSAYKKDDEVNPLGLFLGCEPPGSSTIDDDDDETSRADSEADLPESVDVAKRRVWDLMTAILNNKTAYKTLLGSKGQRAQAILDILQKSLDTDDIPGELRVSALFATIRLCAASGVYPQCLALRGIRYDNEPIASGSFGDIWKGYLGTQTVCLKVARVYAGSDVETVIKGFTGEAILWSQLNHPNLLPFYGIYSVDGRLGRVALVSPWMQNGNVSEYLRTNPEAPRVPLVDDILAGLKYLHEQRIVHGDLKGANILISPDGSACLADFGLSSVVDPNVLRWTSLKTISKAGGTVRWEAPELMDELEDGTSPRPTFLSDVYSVASVMYEVLTGQIPYCEIPRDTTVISRILKGIRPTRPTSGLATELSDGIWNVMEGCWSTDPSNRPPVSQVAEQLQKVPVPGLTMKRIAGHYLQKRKEGGTKVEVLPPRLFRDAIRGFHPTFSKADVDLLREYQS